MHTDKEETKAHTGQNDHFLVTPASASPGPCSLSLVRDLARALWRSSPAVSARRLKISHGRFLASVLRPFTISGIAAASQAPFIGDRREETLCWDRSSRRYPVVLRPSGLPEQKLRVTLLSKPVIDILKMADTESLPGTKTIHISCQ